MNKKIFLTLILVLPLIASGCLGGEEEEPLQVKVVETNYTPNGINIQINSSRPLNLTQINVQDEKERVLCSEKASLNEGKNKKVLEDCDFGNNIRVSVKPRGKEAVSKNFKISNVLELDEGKEYSYGRNFSLYITEEKESAWKGIAFLQTGEKMGKIFRFEVKKNLSVFTSFPLEVEEAKGGEIRLLSRLDATAISPQAYNIYFAFPLSLIEDRGHLEELTKTGSVDTSGGKLTLSDPRPGEKWMERSFNVKRSGKEFKVSVSVAQPYLLMDTIKDTFSGKEIMTRARKKVRRLEKVRKNSFDEEEFEDYKINSYPKKNFNLCGYGDCYQAKDGFYYGSLDICNQGRESIPVEEIDIEVLRGPKSLKLSPTSQAKEVIGPLESASFQIKMDTRPSQTLKYRVSWGGASKEKILCENLVPK